MRKLPRLMLALGCAVALCVAIPQAQSTPRWPVKADLVAKDWTTKDSAAWLKVGEVRIWNTRDDLAIEIIPGKDAKGRPYTIKEVSVATASTPDFSAFLDSKGKPNPLLFPYKTDYLADLGRPADRATQLVSLTTFGLCWGTPDKCPLDRYVLVHAELMLGGKPLPEPAFAGIASAGSTATVSFVTAFYDRKGAPIGWYVTYPFAKVQTGHFVDAKVRGLTFWTPTQNGTSSDSGNFFYIPDERVYFWVGPVPLGSAIGDHTVTPMDLFEGTDLDDTRVLNVARLLQSLDSHTSPGVLDVTENLPCLERAVASLGLGYVDFADDDQVSRLLGAARAECPGLVIVSKEDARDNLNQGQQAGNILRTNVSKDAETLSDKAKIEIMPVYVPARQADDTPTTVLYHDVDGNVIETRPVAKPLVVVYEEEIAGTGARDAVVAISRDDGSTWKRRNLSRTAGRSSLTTAAGVAYPGDVNKPMLSVKENKILVAWTGKYCHGGRPRYAIKNASDFDCDLNGDGTNDGILRTTHEGQFCVPDYPGDDAYRQEDIWGVGGPQRSVLYDPLEWPEMGEVAYSCVWAARGIIDSSGTIVWYKPERLTSGRRDAIQLVSAAAENHGFALAWQEDPKGLRPPSEDGPGDGWSGASVSNKTDIWYSFLRWGDFDRIDTAYLPPDHDDIVDTDPDLGNRPKALVPFSLPVKITDNDVCSLESMLGLGGDDEHAGDEGHGGAPESRIGTHRYCGRVEDIGTELAPGSNPLCAYTIPKTNHNGQTHNVCVTAGDYNSRRVLDGNTGASRPNLFLQPYQRPGKQTASAILAYEESKGLGNPPEVPGEEETDRYKPDLGKNVIYHAFDFDEPETVSGGGVINMPETTASGSPLYAVDVNGNPVLDPIGRLQLAYENARRVRILAQPRGKVGASGTILVALYREGAEGHGKPADIFMRRMSTQTPDRGDGNPYSFDHFAADVQNLTSVTPGEIRTYETEDPETHRREMVTKMVNWSWHTGNLADRSGTEPYSNAVAHRGALNGDELMIAYSWTPNWGRNAPDKYDVFVRRSWDGGRTWKTDPNGRGDITHTIVFIDPETKEATTTVSTFPPGAIEPPRNISNLRNNRISVLEPRLVKTPGTINSPYSLPEDVQNPAIYQIAWGLEVNERENSDGFPFRTPLDIFYGRTLDKGQNYENVIVTRADGSGGPQEGWNLLAKDRAPQAGAQIRQTPDGSRMYAVWVEWTGSGSDIMFRRIDYRPSAR